jgi:hypothetical protein
VNIFPVRGPGYVTMDTRQGAPQWSANSAADQRPLRHGADAAFVFGRRTGRGDNVTVTAITPIADVLIFHRLQ